MTMRNGKPTYEPNGFVQKVWRDVVLGALTIFHAVIDVLRHRHREEDV